MKTINWKISLGFLKRNSIQQHIGIAFVLILSFTLTDCQNATNQEKDRQGKVALAQILNSDSNESKPSKIEEFSQRLLACCFDVCRRFLLDRTAYLARI
jgi:hypothetical protein